MIRCVFILLICFLLIYTLTFSKIVSVRSSTRNSYVDTNKDDSEWNIYNEAHNDRPVSRIENEVMPSLCETPFNGNDTNHQTPCIGSEDVIGHNDEDETIASEIQDFEHDDHGHNDTIDAIAEDVEDIDVVLKGDINLSTLSRKVLFKEFMI